MGGFLTATAVVAVGALLFPGPVLAEPVPKAAPDSLTPRVIRLEAELDAQREARDRQAEAFDAAVSRMEFVNAALVAVIALAGIGGSLLAIRWVRNVAREQVETQMESAIRSAGEKIFQAEATALIVKYEERFAEQYEQYQRLNDQVD